MNQATTLLARDDRTVSGIGIGVVHRDTGDVMTAETARPLHHHLELVGLMEVRMDDRVGLFLDQECHRIQPFG